MRASFSTGHSTDTTGDVWRIMPSTLPCCVESMDLLSSHVAQRSQHASRKHSLCRDDETRSGLTPMWSSMYWKRWPSTRRRKVRDTATQRSGWPRQAVYL